MFKNITTICKNLFNFIVLIGFVFMLGVNRERVRRDLLEGRPRTVRYGDYYNYNRR